MKSTETFSAEEALASATERQRKEDERLRQTPTFTSLIMTASEWARLSRAVEYHSMGSPENYNLDETSVSLSSTKRARIRTQPLADTGSQEPLWEVVITSGS